MLNIDKNQHVSKISIDVWKTVIKVNLELQRKKNGIKVITFTEYCVYPQQTWNTWKLVVMCKNG